MQSAPQKKHRVGASRQKQGGKEETRGENKVAVKLKGAGLSTTTEEKERGVKVTWQIIPLLSAGKGRGKL